MEDGGSKIDPPSFILNLQPTFRQSPMKKKLRVALLFGGQSAEHEISLISARNIVEAMDKKKYEIVSIGIDKQGRWFYDEGARLLLDRTQTKVEFHDLKNVGAVLPGASNTAIVRSSSGAGIGAVDVVFPVLHGPFGEDGTVQGLLKLANLSLCRCRSARFRCRHGQRRHEAAFAGCRDSDREVFSIRRRG